MTRKQISFEVSEEEHTRIKTLAANERRSIKQLFLDMLDKIYPDWNGSERKLKNEPTLKNK